MCRASQDGLQRGIRNMSQYVRQVNTTGCSSIKQEKRVLGGGNIESCLLRMGFHSLWRFPQETEMAGWGSGQ